MNTFLLSLLAQTSAPDPSGAIFGGGIVVLVLAILGGLFWLWMLIDAITNTRLAGTEKIVWILVVFFLSFLGAIIYFFVGRRGSATAA